MINITFSFALFAQSSWQVAQQILRQNYFFRNFSFRMNAKFVNFEMPISFKIKCYLLFIKKFYSKSWIKFLLLKWEKWACLRWFENSNFFLMFANFPKKKTLNGFQKVQIIEVKTLCLFWQRIQDRLGTNWLWMEDRPDSYYVT